MALIHVSVWYYSGDPAASVPGHPTHPIAPGSPGAPDQGLPTPPSGGVIAPPIVLPPEVWPPILVTPPIDPGWGNRPPPDPGYDRPDFAPVRPGMPLPEPPPAAGTKPPPPTAGTPLPPTAEPKK